MEALVIILGIPLVMLGLSVWNGRGQWHAEHTRAQRLDILREIDRVRGTYPKIERLSSPVFGSERQFWVRYTHPAGGSMDHLVTYTRTHGLVWDPPLMDGLSSKEAMIGQMQSYINSLEDAVISLTAREAAPSDGPDPDGDLRALKQRVQ